MAWKVEFVRDAEKELRKLDKVVARRILRFLQERIAPLDNPRALGRALQGKMWGEFWRYRVGDCRVIVRIEDDILTVLVVKVGNRRDIYREK
ncbi:MAG: type II toxin-antitoxin system RelE/ParE family toxin [Cardiobacteriaceae bacterium]|nr:type II toxin-antitoxin system RelE/ParE family toxin [Cardiobacteriaceae bacterium]